MKCLYISIAFVTVISAAVPKEICETCVPTQDCHLFKKLRFEDQLLWMEKFPCGDLPKTNNFKVPAGFASAAKGDYVCCSNNIWGIEKPVTDPQLGHQSWQNNNPPYSNPGDYSDKRNNFNPIDLNPIRFPDWDDSFNNNIHTTRPGNDYNYWNNNGDSNKPTDDNHSFHNNNPNTSHNLDDNNHKPDIYEVSNGSSTVWFPNRTNNYDNTNYWLTHDPGNNFNVPGQDGNTESTERTPGTTFSKRPTNRPILVNRPITRPSPIYFKPNNPPRPFYRNPNYNTIGNSPLPKWPFNNNIPVNNPDENYRPPQWLPRDNSRGPFQYVPPNNQNRPPKLFYPSDNIYRPIEYRPRENNRTPPRSHNILPRQPFINELPERPYYNDQGRNGIDYEYDPYDTQPPFDDINQGNYGGGQCARLTSFPPDPQSDCCGRQLADDDRITGRHPQYNQPAFTNYWGDPFQNAPIWNTRDEVAVNSTDEEVTVERRISGGQATELWQYPWTVLLLTTFDYGNREAAFNCGGGLISARYVLTAGHCVYDKEAAVKSVQINLAEYDKRTFPKDCKVSRNGRKCIENIVLYAEHIIIHPKYENENLVNDIALIRLRGTAPYTEYIRPICLPSFNIDEPHFANLQFEVAGWGRNGPYSSEIKQSTYLHLTNHNQCKRYYPQLTNKHLCAAGQRGADTCKGDSGGPLMILYRGRYYVAGIVSGKRADSPCGTAVPSLYTNVFHYIDWIRRNIKN